MVWVRTRGIKEDGRQLLEYVRWVLVSKRDPASPAPAPVVPDLPDHVAADTLIGAAGPAAAPFDRVLSGALERFDSYAVGERIDHVDGMTIDEAEHRLATRLYQNRRGVHFNAHRERAGASAAASSMAATCSASPARCRSTASATCCTSPRSTPAPRQPGVRGRHHLRLVGGPRQSRAAGHPDLGALRLRLVATKDRPCDDFPDQDAAGNYLPEVVLDFDYWGIMPR